MKSLQVTSWVIEIWIRFMPIIENILQPNISLMKDCHECLSLNEKNH